LYFLYPNGSLINSFAIDGNLLKIMTDKSYTSLLTSQDKVYVFNRTDTILWNKKFNTSFPMRDYIIIKNNLYLVINSSDLLSVDLFTGIQTTPIFSSNNSNNLIISIYNDDQKANQIYFLSLNGLIAHYNNDGSLIWKATLPGNYITQVQIGNVSGGSLYEIIATTDTGYASILNSTSGDIIKSVFIGSEWIASLLVFDINNDSIDDIIVGTLSGKIDIIYGLDLIPPKIISQININVSDSNLFTLSLLTNELTRSILTLIDPNGVESIYKNTTYRNNQTYIISDLQSDTEFNATIFIYDSNNNSIILTIPSFRTKPVEKIPWDLYFGFLVITLVITISGYFFLTTISRKRSANIAEKALNLGDYPNAIKFFYKAKERDKIIEIVRTILANPELASKMNEIARSVELEDYINEIYDIIAHEG
ncbi:MAG: hypothetical protein ACFFD1_04880, partial [Candidatus Thorarchaeota archaeon]